MLAGAEYWGSCCLLAAAEYWGSWDRIEPLMRAPSLDEVGKGGVRVSGDWWSENLMRSGCNTVLGGRRSRVPVPERCKEIIGPGSGRAVCAVVKCLFVMESAWLGRDKRGATAW